MRAGITVRMLAEWRALHVRPPASINTQGVHKSRGASGPARKPSVHERHRTANMIGTTRGAHRQYTGRQGAVGRTAAHSVQIPVAAFLCLAADARPDDGAPQRARAHRARQPGEC